MMNTKEQAATKLVDFFTSDSKVLFMNGTHQHEKHPMVIQTAARTLIPQPFKMLFRSNATANTGVFLGMVAIRTVPKPGTFLNVAGRFRLCADTQNGRSWGKTPHPIDVAIVYPVESMSPDEGVECVNDLLSRSVKKICLVTCSDTRDFAWVNQYNPFRVTYDTEAEDPEHHAEMKQVNTAAIRHRLPTNVPSYAKAGDQSRLLEIECDRCGCKRWAELNADYPGMDTIRQADAGTYEAKCLKCGEVATDNYNWYGR